MIDKQDPSPVLLWLSTEKKMLTTFSAILSRDEERYMWKSLRWCLRIAQPIASASNVLPSAVVGGYISPFKPLNV